MGAAQFDSRGKVSCLFRRCPAAEPSGVRPSLLWIRLDGG